MGVYERERERERERGILGGEVGEKKLVCLGVWYCLF